MRCGVQSKIWGQAVFGPHFFELKSSQTVAVSVCLWFSVQGLVDPSRTATVLTSHAQLCERVLFPAPAGNVPGCRGAGPAMCVHAKLLQSGLTVCTPWTVVHQAPLSIAFSMQVYWSELPCPSPGGLAHPGIELRSPARPADSSLSEPPGNPQITVN